MANKANQSENQIMYLGRWVDKNTFRAFVYNDEGQKLANTYEEFKELIESGLWFTEKKKPEPPLIDKGRRKKHGSDS